MKTIILMILLCLFNGSAFSQGCDGNIQAVINVSEEEGFNPNRHFMWGRAAKLLADGHGCNDAMEEYAGAGMMTVMLYNTNWSGGVQLPSSTSFNGTPYNLYYGQYNSGYDFWSQWLVTDGIAELVKRDYASYIDASGRFIIDITVPCRIDGTFHNNQYTYYHIALIIWTDAKVLRSGATYSCETDNVDFGNLYVSNPTLSNVTITPSGNWISTGSGNVFTAGNIGTNLSSPETFSVEGTYTVPTENMNPNQYPFAGMLVSCFRDYNSGNWAQTSLADLKTLSVNKTFEMPIYNKPSGVQTSAYPNPIYDNDPSIILNNFWSFEGYSSYQFSGGGVSYNTGNSQYEFSPGVGSGLHSINLNLNNQDKCYTTVSSSISVTQYPGTPSKPVLDYDGSFDYVSDSAIITGGCLAPGYYDLNGGFHLDASMWIRHKWLCPNVEEDSIELFIAGPQANLTYYWKRSVNGLEEDLGQGVSKFVPRAHNPSPNSGNTYKEYIYFRSKNVVNNYSPWEYVELEYPIVPYIINSPNDSLSYVLMDSVCHDGSVNYQVTNSLLNDESFLGMTQLSTSPTQYERRYVYTDWLGSQTGTNFETFDYSWNGNKLDTFVITEKGYLRRNLASCWTNADWCNCDVRTLNVIPIKEPDIITATVLDDTTVVGELNSLNTTTDFGGTGSWFIDSLPPPFVGNSAIFYPIGSEGHHDVYLSVEDQYGCKTDTMLNNAYLIKNVEIVYPEPDTLIYGPLPDNNKVCIDVIDGGNLIVTPNNDGVNDEVVICAGNRTFEIVIFDRWGNVLIEKEDVQSVVVEDLPNATYFYRLNSEGEQKSGFIEVKK